MNLMHKTITGRDISPFIDHLGELRIQVFAEWPYLYQGDLAYERNYLQTYAQTHNSLLHMIFNGDQLVGATTAILLADEAEEFKRPFIDKGFDPQKVVYFGESILLPQYRGMGLGKVFMQKRFEFAKRIVGVETVAFCAVMRSPSDVRRPQEYRPLDDFWRSQGFVPQEDMVAYYPWKDIGENIETTKTLKFWMKSIN